MCICVWFTAHTYINILSNILWNYTTCILYRYLEINFWDGNASSTQLIYVYSWLSWKTLLVIKFRKNYVWEKTCETKDAKFLKIISGTVAGLAMNHHLILRPRGEVYGSWELKFVVHCIKLGKNVITITVKRTQRALIYEEHRTLQIFTVIRKDRV